MYKVYCDSYLLYYDSLEGFKIFQPRLNLELNKTGAFEFTIYNNHPYYGMIKKLKSIITIYQNGYLLFRGRVLNDELGFHEEKQVFCEGELAFLLDSIQRPYDYSGSIEGFLKQLITAHNAQVDASKQFTLGNVTVTDPNNTIARSDIDYSNTWDVINKKLIDLLGGYIVVRHEGNVNYLDYLADFTTHASQAVEFSKNLLDMKRIRKCEELGEQVSGLSTTFTQISTAFQLHFDSIDKDLGTFHSYIRFENGNIILGNSDSDLTLKIENDKITFYDQSHAVAYFTNDKLFVNDGIFVNTLRLGCYAFMPRPTGSLSFGKVC